MCKKLIVLLVVCALSATALADYIGLGNPLKVDVLGGGAADSTARGGWQPWGFASSWTSPISKIMNNPKAGGAYEQPIVQLEAYRKQVNGAPATTNDGGSRTRSGSMAFVAGTGEFQPTNKGFGMNYLKLTITQLEPEVNYKFYIWGHEGVGTWVLDTTNPDRKFAAWSNVNPKVWLDDHSGQYAGINNGDPNGYGPLKGDDHPGATTDTNMPGSAHNPYTGEGASLYDAVMLNGTRFNLTGDDVNNVLGNHTPGRFGSFYAPTNDEGTIVLYGWMDATDWGNSMHLPLNGFFVVPEPTTIALLGLGGLALIRRKRA